MILTVTLNPAIDKSVFLENVNLGKVNRMKESQEDVGGKGINVSKVVKQFGVPTAATGVLGNKNQLIFNEFMAESGIDNEFITVEGSTRTNIKVIELNNSRTTDLNDKGLVLSKQTVKEFEDKLIELSKKSDMVVLSGSVPIGLDNAYYGRLIELLNPYTDVILDADGEKLIHGIKSSPRMAKPNKEELEASFGVRLDTNEEVVSFCRELMTKYSIQEMLITMGGDGSLLITEDKYFYSHPIKVDVINTVSAGDSFIGGYLAEYFKTGDYVKSLKCGVTCGTLAVTKKGTELFSLEEYDEMIKNVNVSEF